MASTEMRLTGRISADSLMSLEAYAKWRKLHKPQVIAHRKLRSVGLGEHMTVQFESELTIRYQVQEMLRIEKIFEEEGIQAEIDAYAPLVPDGGNWKATMLIEYPDRRVYAIADEDLPRDNEEKTSAVHFLRFEFTPALRAAIAAGAGVKLGCDHTHYPAHVQIGAETLASLAGDFRS